MNDAVQGKLKRVTMRMERRGNGFANIIKGKYVWDSWPKMEGGRSHHNM